MKHRRLTVDRSCFDTIMTIHELLFSILIFSFILKKTKKTLIMKYFVKYKITYYKYILDKKLITYKAIIIN